MMATSTATKLVSALLLCMLAAASYSEAAITCGQVDGKLGQCLPYLEGKGSRTSACCSGIAALNALAKTASDRRAACNCLKKLAAAYGNKIDLNRAAALPSQCHVKLPYPISLKVDCNKVR